MYPNPDDDVVLNSVLTVIITPEKNGLASTTRQFRTIYRGITPIMNLLLKIFGFELITHIFNSCIKLQQFPADLKKSRSDFDFKTTYGSFRFYKL